jgi:hypothetical protein
MDDLIIKSLLSGGIASLYALAPFPIWRNYFAVFGKVAKTRKLPLRVKLGLIGFLLKDFAATPFYSLAWHLDKLVVTGRQKGKTPAPVCLVGQPRSGTTFLHRTLSQCSGFHSARHAEMRYPFAWAWILLKKSGLDKHIYNRNYWPSTERGKLASRLHSHKLGDHEEHGIFLEERMYHHYFIFRRFPIPELLQTVTDFGLLDDKQMQKMRDAFESVCYKSKYINNATDKPTLLKENESVEFYRKLFESNSDMKFIFIVRDPSQSMSSYQTLSINSTLAKTGLNPVTIEGWQEANDQFRVDECNRMIDFYHSLPEDRRYLLTYNSFVSNIERTVTDILDWLEIPVDDQYLKYLRKTQEKQLVRESGYKNVTHQIKGLSRYSDFVQEAEDFQSKRPPRGNPTHRSRGSTACEQ